MIRAYFRHVHPIMPIVEADGLLNAVAKGRLGDYNVLLVWSVFFAAVNVGLTILGWTGLTRAVHSDTDMPE